MKKLFFLFALWAFTSTMWGQGAPVYLTKPATITGSIVLTPVYPAGTAQPVSVTNQFTAVPYLTQIPYPTPIYPLNTPAPVSVTNQFTPVPQFTAVPYPTQIPYPTAIYPLNTPAPVSVTNQFTPVPYPTAIYPLNTPAPVSITNNTSFALAESTLPTAASSGSGVLALADLFGRFFDFPRGPRPLMGSFSTTQVVSGTAVTFISAIASGYNDIMPGLNIYEVGVGGGTLTIYNTPVTFSYEFGGNSLVQNENFGNWYFETTANQPWVATTSSSSVTYFLQGQYQKNQ
jgi:hypothetical protein